MKLWEDLHPKKDAFGNLSACAYECDCLVRLSV